MSKPKEKSTLSINVRNEAARHAIMDLNGFIDMWTWEGDTLSTSARDFIAKFRELEATNDEITIAIGACYGGMVHEGLAIFDVIAQSSKKINTKVTGLAASMGAIIYLAGHTRQIGEYAQLMVHGPSGGIWGTIEEMENELTALKKAGSILTNIIEKNSNQPLDVVQGWMKKDTYITADEAKTYGLCESVILQPGRKVDVAAVRKMSPTDAFSFYNRYLGNSKTLTDEIKLMFESSSKRIAAALFGGPQSSNQTLIKMEITLSDATILYTDVDTAPAVGDNVFEDDALTTPAADGDYTLGSDLEGYTMVVSSGAIESLTAPQAETQPTTDEQLASLQNQFKELQDQMKIKDNLIAELRKPKGVATPGKGAGDVMNGGSAKPKAYLSPNEKAAKEAHEKLVAKHKPKTA